MTVAVRYFSRTGNTKKLAECVASEAGVTAETVDVALSEKVDVLFLGSAVYAAGVDPSIKDFISFRKKLENSSSFLLIVIDILLLVFLIVLPFLIFFPYSAYIMLAVPSAILHL